MLFQLVSANNFKQTTILLLFRTLSEENKKWKGIVCLNRKAFMWNLNWGCESSVVLTMKGKFNILSITGPGKEQSPCCPSSQCINEGQRSQEGTETVGSRLEKWPQSSWFTTDFSWILKAQVIWPDLRIIKKKFYVKHTWSECLYFDIIYWHIFSHLKENHKIGDLALLLVSLPFFSAPQMLW